MFPMGYLLDFGEEESITVRRMNFRLGKEEKPNMSVKIPYAVTKADFISERKHNSLPVMPNAYGHTEYDENGNTYLCFDKGESDDFVHSYAVFTATERGTIISRIFIRVSPLWLTKSNFLFTLSLRECII